MRNSLIPAIAVLALLAGCGGEDDNSAGDAPAKNIDACGLLTDSEVTTAIGQHGPGQQTSVDQAAPICQWSGAAGQVSLVVGAANSAPGGQLPSEAKAIPAKNGPDGVQFVLPGSARFVAGDRLNVVTVSKGRTNENDLNNAAAPLAKAVTAKLGK